MDLQVFVFTWNTQTVRYNVNNGPTADFVHVLSDRIISSEHNYDLVVIGLQEDAIRDSPLLADKDSLLGNGIAAKYELLEILSLSGWGSTTYKALKNEWEYRPRGLRLAVFKRKDLVIKIEKVESMDMVCPGIRDWFTCGKGGLAVSLHTSLGKVCFLNVHLPFNSRSIIQDPVDKISYRHEAVMWQAKCLRTLYEYTVDEYLPDYLIILGDLNFRVQIRTESGATDIATRIFNSPGYIAELIREADELHLLFDYSQHSDQDLLCEGPSIPPVPVMNEGIDDSGPVFLPTCKMRQGREYIEECKQAAYSLGIEDQRTPSWCDRILYKQFKKGNNIKCIYYNRWEHGTMRMSDHSAVTAVFKISR